MSQMDFGPNPYIMNVQGLAAQNQNFRAAIWTGCNVQMTLMHIQPYEEIGWEMHDDTNQIIRVEQGTAVVLMGEYRGRTDTKDNIRTGDVVFVPAGTWHNVMNAGRCPLKVSSIYAPPNHKRGTIHRTKKDAEYGH